MGTALYISFVSSACYKTEKRVIGFVRAVALVYIPGFRVRLREHVIVIIWTESGIIEV